MKAPENFILGRLHFYLLLFWNVIYWRYQHKRKTKSHGPRLLVPMNLASLFRSRIRIFTVIAGGIRTAGISVTAGGVAARAGIGIV